VDRSPRPLVSLLGARVEDGAVPDCVRRERGW